MMDTTALLIELNALRGKLLSYHLENKDLKERLASQPTMVVDLGGDSTPEFERSVRTFWEQAQIAERSRIATLVRALPVSYFDVGTSGNRVMVPLVDRDAVLRVVEGEA